MLLLLLLLLVCQCWCVCVLMPVQLALPSTESNKTMPGTQGTVYCWLLPSARMRAILIELN